MGVQWITVFTVLVAVRRGAGLATGQQPSVQTPVGPVLGLAQGEGVEGFLGIPYAAPPGAPDAVGRGMATMVLCFAGVPASGGVD